MNHVILLCPCSAPGAPPCVRKCCHPRSVLLVDAKGDSSCETDPLALAHHADGGQQPGVASAAEYNRARAAEALREWGPNQHRHPDQRQSGESDPSSPCQTLL